MNQFYESDAQLYDLIYGNKNYANEAWQIVQLLKRNGAEPGCSLLDVACGTGGHLNFWQYIYVCTGCDISEDMLRIARRKVHHAQFTKANMLQLDLKKKFNVITCMFSAIGYTRTLEGLKQAVEGFAKHLNSGGVLVFDPWIDPDEFIEGNMDTQVYENERLKVVRHCVSQRKDDQAVMDFHFLVTQKGQQPRYFVDRHVLGLFSVRDTMQVMQEAGFFGYWMPELLGRGLYMGILE